MAQQPDWSSGAALKMLEFVEIQTFWFESRLGYLGIWRKWLRRNYLKSSKSKDL